MKWFSSCVSFLLALVVLLPFSEAGGRSKSKYRSVSTFSSSCANGQCSVKSSSVVRASAVTAAPVMTSIQSQPVSVSSGWEQEAQSQADEMAARGTYGHVRGARETAVRAGSPGSSVFVGTGVNGATCRGSGRLVADAVSYQAGRSYHCRIWLR